MLGSFFAASLAALALRLVFVLHFPAVVDDSRLYADIAENWLQHGVYGITDSGQIMPTLSRLPGYPAFLAAIFAVFGWSNFRAVLLIQVLFDLGTCFLVADLARRIAPSVRRRRRSCSPHSVHSWPTTRPPFSPRRWKYFSQR